MMSPKEYLATVVTCFEPQFQELMESHYNESYGEMRSIVEDIWGSTVLFVVGRLRASGEYRITKPISFTEQELYEMPTEQLLEHIKIKIIEGFNP